jgi:hypothetical protein
MLPKSYNFIEYKVNEFINNCDISIKPIIKKVLNNTTYISFEIFMTYLIKNFKNFINIKELFIYIPLDYLNKSNYWIYQLMDYYKNKIGFKGKLILISTLNDERLSDNSIVLITDDCIYSGEQMRLIIEYMINSRKLNLDIYLFISFMTYEGLNKITNEFINNINLITCNLKLMENIYYIDKTVNNYLNIDEIDLLEDYYSCPINHRYLLYFDHKMPDYYSTIPLIYSGIIANFNNKFLLKAIRKDKRFEFKEQVSFIQFIKNTDEIRNFDVLKPMNIKNPYN